ncbi:MAG: molybdopterin-dependent oxidoreductase [Acidobacteriota bacterium]|jgi:anaerobic selenocysteine-containing dehydrogenase
MLIERREFLKLLGLTVGAVGLEGCGADWLVPDDLVELALRGPGLETHERTVCGLCEGRCGLSVRLVDGLPVGLRGNPGHPLNRGGLCPVGQAGLDVLYSPHRLSGPARRAESGARRPAAWDEVLQELADRLGGLLAAGRGDRIVLFTEEPDELFHDLARRFAAAFGSNRVARPGAGTALPYRLAQGTPGVPGFDLNGADLVFSFGLDLYEGGAAPLHAVSATIGSRPIGEKAVLLHAGTRLSPSATKAEEFLAIHPATHGALALGVAHVLVREGSHDRRFVEERCFGFDDWTDEEGRPRLGFRRLLLERYYPDRVARLCGVDPVRIIEVARRFAAADAPLALAGGEAVQGTNGVWTVLAVHALNALAGSFDRRGGVVLPPPVALTPLAPLPTAAASPPGADPFAPRAGEGGAAALGTDPVEALADRVLDGSAEVEVLFLIGSNPVHASPAGERFRRALERIPLVVACAPFEDETAAVADLVLPAHHFLEAWSTSTTPAGVPFSVLGVGHPIVEPLRDTRHPGDLLLEIARRAGEPAADALPWSDYPAYLRHRVEGLVVSGQGSVISGSFEESWVQFLEERGWRFLQENTVEDFWRDLAREGGWWNPVRARGAWDRLLATPSGRYELCSRELERHLREVGAAAGGGSPDGSEGAAAELARGVAALGLAADPDEACLPHYEPPREVGDGELVLVPFRPITGRGALGTASRMLLEMFGYPSLTGWETWAEIAPETARELDLGDGDRVAIESPRGEIEATVRIGHGSTPGVVHVPVGLGRRETAAAAAGVGANPLDVVAPAHDPVSGALVDAATRVRLRLVERRRRGGPAPEHGGEA